MYEKELGKLGLGEKEAKVYLAALELGPETVQNLAKKAGINRPTAYVQIEALKKRGLMSEFEKGKKTFYSPESPERLETFLRTLESDLVTKKSDLKSILPFLLSSFSGMGERPKVRFFEGYEGANAMRKEFLAVKNKNIVGITNLDKLSDLFPKHQEEYSKVRIAKKIKSKIIYTTKKGPIKELTDPKQLREAKFVPLNKFPLTADITIFDNKVSIVTYDQKTIGVVLDGKDIADSFRAIFELLWNAL